MKMKLENEQDRLSVVRSISFDGKQYLLRLPKKLLDVLMTKSIYCGRYGHRTVELKGVYRTSSVEKKYCVLVIFS